MATQRQKAGRPHLAGLRPVLVAAIAVAAHLPAACGGGRTPPGVIQGARAADREFLDEMAYVLEMARESAGQAVANVTRPELKEYAPQVRDQHASQLSAVRSLDQTLFSRENAGAGAIPAQIAPGPNFDREWLASMIEVHQLGVEVAAARLEEQGDPQVEALARQLHASERQELERLRAWSRQWFGGGT
jgi:uncharacterized protein (DUF305 family)